MLTRGRCDVYGDDARKEGSGTTRLLCCRLFALRSYGLTRLATVQPSALVRKAVLS